MFTVRDASFLALAAARKGQSQHGGGSAYESQAWYDTADQIQPLNQLFWNALPPLLRRQVYILPPQNMSMLRSTLGNKQGIQAEHCDCIIHNNDPDGSSHLRLLIIPLMANTGTKDSQENHYTCLYIDLLKQKYFYQDSLGPKSAYGRFYKQVHELMLQFFLIKPELSFDFDTLLASPKIIDEYFSPGATADKFPAFLALPPEHRSICVDYVCYHQQLNSDDCGPAVIDNTLAVLHAFTTGWSIETWPSIIAARCRRLGYSDYRDYYQQVRCAHKLWQNKKVVKLEFELLNVCPILSSDDQVVLAGQFDKNKSNPAQYWLTIFNAFFKSIRASNVPDYLSEYMLTVPAEKWNQLNAYSVVFLGTVLNQLWFYKSASDVAKPRVLIEVMEAYRDRISKVLCKTFNKTLLQEMLLHLWGPDKNKERGLIFIANQKFHVAVDCSKSKTSSWVEQSKNYLQALKALRDCLNVVFPAELIIAGRSNSTEIVPSIVKFFTELQSLYESLSDESMCDKKKREHMQYANNKYMKMHQEIAKNFTNIEEVEYRLVRYQMREYIDSANMPCAIL